ncbi:hypothetical protein FB451DRAFT_1455160 [Mycena latifolia]|nr:hypothetical protein FB451DRAFT_1455160 [Mycena latifolia]
MLISATSGIPFPQLDSPPPSHPALPRPRHDATRRPRRLQCRHAVLRLAGISRRDRHVTASCHPLPLLPFHYVDPDSPPPMSPVSSAPLRTRPTPLLTLLLRCYPPRHAPLLPISTEQSSRLTSRRRPPPAHAPRHTCSAASRAPRCRHPPRHAPRVPTRTYDWLSVLCVVDASSFSHPYNAPPPPRSSSDAASASAGFLSRSEHLSRHIRPIPPGLIAISAPILPSSRYAVPSPPLLSPPLRAPLPLPSRVPLHRPRMPRSTPWRSSRPSSLASPYSSHLSPLLVLIPAHPALVLTSPLPRSPQTNTGSIVVTPRVRRRGEGVYAYDEADFVGERGAERGAGAGAFCGMCAGWHGIPPGGLRTGGVGGVARGFTLYSIISSHEPPPPSFLPRTHATDAAHARLLPWFLDAPAAPLSVHRMALAGKAAGKDVGMWVGPSVAAGAIRFVVFHAFYSSFPSRSLPLVFCGFDTILLSSFLVHGGFCVYVAIPTFILLHVLPPPGRLLLLPP